MGLYELLMIVSVLSGVDESFQFGEANWDPGTEAELCTAMYMFKHTLY